MTRALLFLIFLALTGFASKKIEPQNLVGTLDTPARNVLKVKTSTGFKEYRIENCTGECALALETCEEGHPCKVRGRVDETSAVIDASAADGQ